MAGEDVTNTNTQDQKNGQNVVSGNTIKNNVSNDNVNEAKSRNDNEIESKETAIPTDYTPFLAMGGIFIVVIGVLLVVVSKNRSSLKKGAVANESSSTSRTRTR